MLNLEFFGSEFLKVAESAAILSSTMSGYGDRTTADLYATQAMRKVLNTLDIKGRIVIGEGERDKAPMLYIGEKVGTGKGPEIDIAVDPLEGTNLCATFNPNTICVLAASERGGLMHAPDSYMEKLIYGPKLRGMMNLDDPVKVTLEKIADAENISIHQVIVIVLDRERHHKLINDIYEAGARVKLITDGDIMGSISAVMPHTISHVVMGIGAAPEGVITAAAMRALGGGMQARFTARDTKEKKRFASMGIKDMDRIYSEFELASGEQMLFVATGVTNGDVLKGVTSDEYSIFTHSVLLDAHEKTIQFVETLHKIK